MERNVYKNKSTTFLEAVLALVEGLTAKTDDDAISYGYVEALLADKLKGEEKKQFNEIRRRLYETCK